MGPMIDGSQCGEWVLAGQLRSYTHRPWKMMKTLEVATPTLEKMVVNLLNDDKPLLNVKKAGS